MALSFRLRSSLQTANGCLLGANALASVGLGSYVLLPLPLAPLVSVLSLLPETPPKLLGSVFSGLSRGDGGRECLLEEPKPGRTKVWCGFTLRFRVPCGGLSRAGGFVLGWCLDCGA